MKTGMIQTLIEIFTQVFAQLRVPITAVELEELAVTVHKAMTVQSRNYHSIEHVLAFRDPANPIQTLAALYHDIVYYQVDMGYTPEIEQVISPYIFEEGAKIILTDTAPVDDRMFHMTVAAFGFIPGQVLTPFGGLNEFLSSLFMNEKLGGIVSEIDLLRMTLCIEGTIPFRSADQFYRLEDRVHLINDQFGLKLEPAAIEEMVKSSVIFANKDVENFADEDAASFLDGTWKLLSETNAALRYGIYTVRQYRLALQKTEGFMSTLNPGLVFHKYRGTPAEEEFQNMSYRAQENLKTAVEYLRIKLLTAAVLEALAEISGGDVPLSLFMGDIPRFDGEPVKRIEDFLPEPEVIHFIDMHSTLFRLLEEGRTTAPGFDLRNAPLSLFIYKSLDPQRSGEKFEAAQQFFRGELTAADFLNGCHSAAIDTIARAAASMVPTRREKLLEFARTHYS